MKTFYRLAISFIIFQFFFISFPGWSQQRGFSPEIDQFIEKKLHHLIRVEDVDGFLEMAKNNPERLMEMQAEDQSRRAARGEAQGREVVVSDINLPESELHAVMNPQDSNHIVIGVMRQDPSSFTAPLTTPIYYTRDFGQSWEMSSFRGEFPGLGLWAGGGDPVLVYDSKGVIHYTWLVIDLNTGTFRATIGLYHMTSADGGENWDFQGVTDVSSDFDLLTFDGIDKFVDKQWMAVDDSEGSNRDNVYMAYVALEFDSTSVNYVMNVATKYADSMQFSDPVIINPEGFLFSQFASIDVDQSGRVHATFAGSKDSINYGMYHTYSEDGGQSFSRPRLISPFTLPELTYIDPDFSIVGVQERLYACPHVITDHSEGQIHSGRIYCFWTANGVQDPRGLDLDIYYSFSDDGGLSWTPAFVLDSENAVGSHQYYSSINTTPSGRIVATYYDRQAGGDDRMTDYVLTQSDDGGISWTEPVVLTGASSDFSVIGSENSDFGIGEYNQTLVTDYQAIPIWADGRTNDGNINVYAAFAPFNEDFSVSVENWYNIGTNWEVGVMAPNPVSTGDWVRWDLRTKSNSALEVQWINQAGQRMGVAEKLQIQGGVQQPLAVRAPMVPGVYYLQMRSTDGIHVQKVVVQ